MCIGIPLQVETVGDDGLFAECGDGVRRERLDLRLVGAQPPGTWVLAFNGAARRVLEAGEATQIRAALRALDEVLNGDASQVDVLFADLIGREPQLPAHLRPPAPTPIDLGAAPDPAGANTQGTTP
jgi:hydrogenase expression/formation protein HypC